VTRAPLTAFPSILTVPKKAHGSANAELDKTIEKIKALASILLFI
jgi:hypothetical protein